MREKSGQAVAYTNILFPTLSRMVKGSPGQLKKFKSLKPIIKHLLNVCLTFLTDLTVLASSP
ncbi:hypothetical protein [Nostoc sp.]|uniref:hypothetical protein n=1 Tax=Nostoc sp. TaxID=1180 RepID=UPI002FF510C9